MCQNRKVSVCKRTERMQRVHVPNLFVCIRAATNDYSDSRLIYRLLKRLID